MVQSSSGRACCEDGCVRSAGGGRGFASGARASRLKKLKRSWAAPSIARHQAVRPHVLYWPCCVRTRDCVSDFVDGQKSRGGPCGDTRLTSPANSTTMSSNSSTGSNDLDDRRHTNLRHEIIMQCCTLGGSHLGSHRKHLSRCGIAAVEARTTVLHTTCERRAGEGSQRASQMRGDHRGCAQGGISTRTYAC